MSGTPRRADRLIAPSLCAALTLAFFWRLFAHGHLPIPFDSLAAEWQPWRSLWQNRLLPHNPQIADAVLAILPYRAFALEALRAGRLPLWNPLISCGAPFLANGQSAVLQPLNFLKHLPPASIQTLAVVAQVPIAFLGMWAFLRGRGLSPVAAAAGALPFAVGGFAVVWLEWGTILFTFSLLPWVLWAVDHLFAGRRWALPIGALLLGADAYLGHLQYAAYVAGVVAAYGFARSLVRPARLPALLAMLALAAAFAGTQLLPSLELSRYAYRHPPPPSGILNHMPAPYLLSFVSPDLFGNPVDRNFHALGEQTPLAGINYNEFTAYLGLLVLALALWGLRFGGRAAWFFAVLAALSAGAAYGGAPARALIATAPWLRSLYICRLLAVTAFALCVLGAYGMEALVSRTQPRLALHLPVAGAGLALAAAAALWATRVTHQAGIFAPEHILWPALALGACALLALFTALGPRRRTWPAWLCLAVLATDLLSFGARYNSYASPAIAKEFYTTLAAASQVPKDNFRAAGDAQTLPPDLGMLAGLPFADGYDSLNLRGHVQVWEIANRKPVWGNRLKAEDFRSAIWSLWGVRHQLVTNPALPGALALRQRPEVLPRAFVAAALSQPSEAQVAALANDPRNAPTDQATLARLRLMPASRDLLPDSVVRFLGYQPERVSLDVSTPAPGWLVLTDSYFPGWQAYVDGTRRPVERAYHTLRAVSIEHDSRVEFVYWPVSVALGLFLSALAVAASAACLAWRKSR